MRTKKWLTLLLALCMVFSLAACGGQTNTSQELGGIFPAIAGENGTIYDTKP